MVEVRGAGILSGVDDGNPITTTRSGSYGSADRYGVKLLGQGQVAEGTVLTFYVNGVAAAADVSLFSGTAARPRESAFPQK